MCWGVRVWIRPVCDDSDDWYNIRRDEVWQRKAEYLVRRSVYPSLLAVSRRKEWVRSEGGCAWEYGSVMWRREMSLDSIHAQDWEILRLVRAL